MEPERDLMYWMQSFCVLDDLSVRFSPAEASPLRLRLRNDICATRKHFSTLLSGLFFDVIVKMCFGKAMHGRSKCGLVISEIDGTVSIKDVYKLAEQCDPKTVLPKLREIFLNCGPKTYDGRDWGIISETAMKYWSLPHELFIVCCLDLYYHGGLAFDDIETGFHIRNKHKYLDILNCKKNGSLPDAKGILPVFNYVAALLRRARHLNVISAVPTMAISYHGFYRPVQWGGASLSDPQSLESQHPTNDQGGTPSNVHGKQSERTGAGHNALGAAGLPLRGKREVFGPQQPSASRAAHAG